ncbi:MAG: DHHA1 domain-containing protein, partial [Candidatus Hydrogenedentota bacterium]
CALPICVSECRRYSYSTITLADMESNQATAEDLDGLVNLTRDIEGVAVGALFREMEGEQTKVSLRSKSGFNSSACLNSFGGGGHAGAAGLRLICLWKSAGNRFWRRSGRNSLKRIKGTL